MTGQRQLAEHRKPLIDRTDDLKELQELVTQFVRDALDDGTDKWGVKVVNGRPIAPHVTRFVASVTRKAA